MNRRRRNNSCRPLPTSLPNNLESGCVIAASVNVRLIAQQHVDTVSTEVITVSDIRPVADALLSLERKYGVVISYEDPEYVYWGDFQDVTTKVRHDGKSFPRVIVPKSIPFRFRFLVRSGNPQEDTEF